MHGIPKINAFDKYFLPRSIILAIPDQVWNYRSVTALIPDGQIKREPGLPFYKMTDGRTSKSAPKLYNFYLHGRKWVGSVVKFSHT